MKPEKAKTGLYSAVQDLVDCKWFFSSNPQKDFIRKRKLSFEQIVKAILCMRGGSIPNELMDIFGIREDLVTTSAFVQQRAKILSEAFEGLFSELYGLSKKQIQKGRIVRSPHPFPSEA